MTKGGHDRLAGGRDHRTRGRGGVRGDLDAKTGAEQGKLTTVKVADPKGNEVEGEISADGASWTPSATSPPPPSTRCTRPPRTPRAVSRRRTPPSPTLVPANTFIGHYTPEDGSTVGVGMPVSINFTRGITDPDAVEKGIGDGRAGR
ncbi:hypothetical protein SBADM41S_07318 [Streptomyces badius]